MIRKWNLFARNRTSPVVGVVEAFTKIEAQEIGFAMLHYMVDADLVRTLVVVP